MINHQTPFAKSIRKLLFFWLFLVPFIYGFAQNQTHKATNIQSPFIFDNNNLEQNAKDLSAIYSQMGKYYEGVEKANTALLEEVFHENWFMRDTETPLEATLNVENKQKFIRRVSNHGPYPGYAKDRKFTTIGLANDNIAFVRINKKSSTSFFLYKVDNEWIIIDKLWTPIPSANSSESQSSAYSQVEELLHGYFKALNHSNQESLNQILHKQWDRKIIDAKNKITIINKNTFLQNLKINQNLTSYDQLRAIDVYHGKLAIVRIDFTKNLTTSFLFLFKVDGKWKIAGERTTIKKNVNS